MCAAGVLADSHFGWDSTIDGVRYLQAPLSNPDERTMRLGTIATGNSFPHGEPASPLLVYDACTSTYPPRYDAGWSNFYARYPRRPDLCHLVAPYVATRFKPIQGVGKSGWLSENDNPNGDEDGNPTPAWALGPADAVRLEKKMRRRQRRLSRDA